LRMEQKPDAVDRRALRIFTQHAFFAPAPLLVYTPCWGELFLCGGKRNARGGVFVLLKE
jgi:hypothetical protein